MIEISCEQKEELTENIEKALHYAGRAMNCIEQMCEADEIGYRRGVKGTGRYGMGRRDDMEYDAPHRNPMGMRYGYRDPLLY